MGATGVGKTYLACALGIAASRNFFAVRYTRLPDLLSDLAIAKADGTYRKVIKQYTQVKLLILDEWLLFPLNETEARNLLEIIEARHHQGSTIFCSQFDVDEWYPKIGEPVLAEAVCDRIVHKSHRIVLSGESMRKRNGITE
jgi:DNA replication protein DnaC